MSPAVEVVEFTDPGCPWSWGAEPVLRWLRHAYGEQEPAQALARWGSVTERELELLCGWADPPADAVEVRTATSSLWIDPERAAAGNRASAVAEATG